VHTQPEDLLLVIFASLVIATIAPLYPAMQAARLDPVAAIRSE
jgi:ABC-type lipoprotein release transport system permease subunit